MQGGWSEILRGGWEELFFEGGGALGRLQEAGEGECGVETCGGQTWGRQDVNYKMNVLNTFGRDNQIGKTDEALRISGHKGVILNSKSEFRQPSLPRFVIQLGRNTQ